MEVICDLCGNFSLFPCFAIKENTDSSRGATGRVERYTRALTHSNEQSKTMFFGSVAENEDELFV